MFGSDRARKLNARAVEKLNDAMLSARVGSTSPGEADLTRAIDAVLTGQPAAKLESGGLLGTILFWIVIAVLVVASIVNEKIGGALAVVFAVLVVLPVVVSLLGSLFSWMKEITDPFSTHHGPSCDVSGCDSSAQYVLNPTPMRQVNLCYTHKSSVEHRLQYASLFEPKVAQSIVDAFRDLKKAAELEPGSTVIAENLKQARDLAEIVLETKVE